MSEFLDKIKENDKNTFELYDHLVKELYIDFLYKIDKKIRPFKDCQIDEMTVEFSGGVELKITYFITDKKFIIEQEKWIDDNTFDEWKLLFESKSKKCLITAFKRIYKKLNKIVDKQ